MDIPELKDFMRAIEKQREINKHAIVDETLYCIAKAIVEPTSEDEQKNAIKILFSIAHHRYSLARKLQAYVCDETEFLFDEVERKYMESDKLIMREVLFND